MATPKMNAALMREALRAMEKNGGNQARAAISLGIARSTLQGRLRMAELANPAPVVDAKEKLADRLRAVETELKFAKGAALDADFVKRKIIGLSEAMDKTDPPDWLVRPTKAFSGAGVPTLFASDFHWGEIVDPNQIGGVNKFNMAIAHERLRTMVAVAIDLLRNHITSEDGYPGIVFALGGDMVSGDIHEELQATNEAEIMKVVVDLFGALRWAIRVLADEFGQVFAPCVGGNHGRNTHKIRAKGRNFTSY